MANGNPSKVTPRSRRAKITAVVLVIGILLAMIPVSGIIAYALSPSMYAVTTARWTDWDADNTDNVRTAMGEEHTEERFRLYFQYYNVELGHGLLHYNHGAEFPIAEEEQLVNDFAVAYWKYYGEPDKNPNHNYSMPSKNFLGLFK